MPCPCLQGQGRDLSLFNSIAINYLSVHEIPIFNLHTDISFASKFGNTNLCQLHNALCCEGLRAGSTGAAVFREAMLCRNKSFSEHSSLEFCSLANKPWPSRVPAGLDLVPHQLGYTACGSGDTFTGLVPEYLLQFCLTGSVNTSLSPSSTAKAHGHIHCQKSDNTLDGPPV